jgi:hypothetical protein
MREDRRVEQRDDDQRMRTIDRRHVRVRPVHEHPVDGDDKKELREITECGAAPGSRDGPA